MKYNYLYILLISFLFSCNSSDKEDLSEVLDEKNIENYLSVPIYKPFNLKLNSKDDTTTSNAALAQIYEGLFWVNPETELVEPLLVEKYSIDPSGTVYTFKLKNNIFFHDDPCFTNGRGRQVFSEDVMYCLNNVEFSDSIVEFIEDTTRIVLDTTLTNLTKDSLADTNKLVKKLVMNKKPKFKSRILETTLVSNYQFTVRISRPDPNFTKQLCDKAFHIYPKEMNTFYYNTKVPKLIGTGPYTIYQYSEDEIILLKNKRYHLENTNNITPKLDAIRFVYIKDIKSTKELYKNGDIDFYIKKQNDSIIIEKKIDINNFNKLDYKYHNYKSINIRKIEPTLPTKEEQEI
jgi:oligopeptide transport system substrate-binding protein